MLHVKIAICGAQRIFNLLSQTEGNAKITIFMQFMAVG